MHFFKKGLLVLLIIPATLFSAVNNEAPQQDNSLKDNTYPLILTDSKNREVIISSEPQKIISVAPNITETIYALGAEELLVGRSNFCDYPSQTSKVPSIGDLFKPNIEKIVEINPDIILAGTHFQLEVLQKLEEANITVVIIQEEGNMNGVYKGITKVGQIVNKAEEAEVIINNMKSRIDSVINKISGDKPRVYYVVGFGEYGDYTAGGDTFISELIELAGGVNIAKESIGWTYSLEKIIEKNPDIVLCSKYFNTPEQLMGATGYKDLPAIKNGHLFPIDNNLLDRAGPRVADGVEILYEIFYK